MSRYFKLAKKFAVSSLFKKAKIIYGRFQKINLFLLVIIYFLFVMTNKKEAAVVTNTEKIIYRDIIKEVFNFTENEIAETYSRIKLGGIRKNRTKSQNVALIIPYRNRPRHLNVFLRNIHYFLNDQSINYGIFVVEQIQNQTFNKAKLMNAGFMEISKDEFWDCFIFHDVDLLPENKDIKYECNEKPTHFSTAVNKLSYEVWPFLFGGVTGMRKEYFIKINGYSNEFWGWGGEDEAMGMRIHVAGDKFLDIPVEIGRYKMHEHKRDADNKGKPFRCLLKLMDETSFHYKKDGLSSLKCKLVSVKKERLFTHYVFDLLEEESSTNVLFKC